MSTINTTTQTEYSINQLFAIITSIPDDELGTEDEPSIISKCRNRIWSYMLAQGFPFYAKNIEIPKELHTSLNVLLYYHGIPVIDIPEEKELA